MEEFGVKWSLKSSNKEDKHFKGYPDEGIIDWHKRNGFLKEEKK